MNLSPGAEARRVKGRLAANKWLLARRATQISLLALFLLGPWAGIWIVKGNLTSSLTLELLPLTDPFVLLQSLFAGHLPYRSALLGAALVLAFYVLVGGRVFCSWVCPVNMLTDSAAWLRRRLDIRGSSRLSRSARYWMLAMVMVLAAATGSLSWELVNPVGMFHRGLIFGMGAAWLVLLAVFLFDLFVIGRGWCGHLCPMGAFYSLLGRARLLRVSATRRAQCDNCMDCFAVCPESQVIRPALKGAEGSPTAILASSCTNCGRCIDVCPQDVFEYRTRLSAEDASVSDSPGPATR